MILVVMGSSEEVAEEVVREFMRRHPTACRRLYVNHFMTVERRLSFLDRALGSAASGSRCVTLIPQVVTNNELMCLRERGAYVAHVYGILSSRHSDIQILRGDYMLGNPCRSENPAHVMTIDEVMSDLQFRRRKMGRGVRA